MRYIEKMQQREKVAAEKAAKEAAKEATKVATLQSRLNDLRSVMKKLNYSPKEACDFLDIPQDQQAEYIEDLKQTD